MTDDMHLLAAYRDLRKVEQENASQLAAIVNTTAITTTHQFADDTARDAYFSAHPTELVVNLFIGVGAGFQQYLASAWVSKTAVVSEWKNVLTVADATWEV